MHTCNIQHKLLLFVCSKDHATCDPKKESMRRDKLKLAPVFQCSWKPKAFPAFFVLSFLIFTWISISSNKRTHRAHISIVLFLLEKEGRKKRNAETKNSGKQSGKQKKLQGKQKAELYVGSESSRFISSVFIQCHNCEKGTKRERYSGSDTTFVIGEERFTVRYVLAVKAVRSFGRPKLAASVNQRFWRVCFVKLPPKFWKARESLS